MTLDEESPDDERIALVRTRLAEVRERMEREAGSPGNPPGKGDA